MLIAMLKTVAVGSVVVGLILAGGCGSDGPNGTKDSGGAQGLNVGTYELDVEELRTAILGPGGKEPNSLQKVQLAELEKIVGKLVLNADGTCLMTSGKGGQVHRDAGTWRVEGDKLFLDGKDRTSGEPVTAAATLVDGVAKLPDPQAPGGALTFRKVAK